MTEFNPFDYTSLTTWYALVTPSRISAGWVLLRRPRDPCRVLLTLGPGETTSYAVSAALYSVRVQQIKQNQ